MRPLYEIPTEQYQALADYERQILETADLVAGGEIDLAEALKRDDAAADALEAELDRFEAEFNVKAEGVAKAILNMEQSRDVALAKAEPFIAEARRYQASAKRAERACDWLKSYLLHQMQRMDLKKVEGVDLKVGRQNNGRPSVVVENLEKVPAELLIPQDPKVDSGGAVEAWKLDGKKPDAVPGLRFDLGQHVRIR